MKKQFLIHSPNIIANVSQFLTQNWQAFKAHDEVLEVIIQEYKSTRNKQQNALLHAVLTDISKQVKWHGQLLDVVTWKRLCTAAWLREKNEQPQLIPALDGKGFDIIFERTSKLSVKDCADLCTWCIAFGDEHNVKFKQRNIN
jgi:hypothetical protein